MTFPASLWTICPSLRDLNIFDVVYVLCSLVVAVLASLLAVSLPNLEGLVFEVPYPQGVPLVGEPTGARRFCWKTRLAYYTSYQERHRKASEDPRLQKAGMPGLPLDVARPSSCFLIASITR